MSNTDSIKNERKEKAQERSKGPSEFVFFCLKCGPEAILIPLFSDLLTSKLSPFPLGQNRMH